MRNGVVFNAADLAWEYELQPTSSCDSEIIAQLIETLDRCRSRRLRLAALLFWNGAYDPAEVNSKAPSDFAKRSQSESGIFEPADL